MSQDQKNSTGNQLEQECPAQMGYCRHWRRELRRRDPWWGVFPGILILLLGMLFLASNIIGFDMALWWPAAMIAVGIAILTRVFLRRC